MEKNNRKVRIGLASLLFASIVSLPLFLSEKEVVSADEGTKYTFCLEENTLMSDVMLHPKENLESFGFRYGLEYEDILTMVEMNPSMFTESYLPPINADRAPWCTPEIAEKIQNYMPDLEQEQPVLEESSLEQSVQDENKQGEESISSIIALLFPEQIQYWAPKFEKWEEKYKVPRNMQATVVTVESCGDPEAFSGSAYGLFQVTSMHFNEGEDYFHIGTNAKRGNKLLRQLIERYGKENYEQIFAAYNGGPKAADMVAGRISKQDYIDYINSFPQWRGDGKRKANEVERYVHWTTGIYDAALKGKDHSKRLDKFMNNASGMCSRALDWQANPK